MLNRQMVIINKSIECVHSSSSESGTYNIENVNSGRSHQNLKFHFHEVYEIYLFLSGDITYHGEAVSKKLERGDLILCNPYSFHCSQLMSECDYERIVINIDRASLQKISAGGTDLSKCFDSDRSSINLYKLSEQETGKFVKISDMLEDEIHTGGYGSDALVSAYLTELMVLINRHRTSDVVSSDSSAMPEIVLNTLNYINEHLTEEVSLDSISKALHHNSDYISRRFRESTLLTISQYTTAKRIIAAEKLLLQGVSPTDACFSTGFNNYTHFARTFKEVTGLSPREFGGMRNA
ncbi:MAG: AraC family transcriptional regulator [Oscillospiraceae bacterium]|nr:AraC family transcriptional regulator [Oscillospiraceae bacterium]